MARILIIEDEAVCRYNLRSILEQAGHTVVEASDGQEGLTRWRRAPTDVVVTDVYMPSQDGFEVLLALRKMSPKPKIICMSGGRGRDGLDWAPIARSLGADSLLHKPFDDEALVVAVQTVLAGPTDPRHAPAPSVSTS
ncbi:MAG: response regulator [Nitrospirota bacterium]